MKNEPTRVAVDRKQWSENSQRTYFLIEFYEDIRWTCRGCGQASVFTAQEQKQVYEIEQRYIYWRPVLCDACTAKKQAAAEAVRRYEARWQVNKQALQDDIPFLKNWAAQLEAYAQLTGRKNRTMIQMLQRLIRERR